MRLNCPAILSLAAAILLALPMQAQDTTTEAPDKALPLMEILSLVPDTPAVREGTPVVSYIDYRALEAAWPATPIYESWAEWNTASEAKDFGARLWMSNRMRMAAGPMFWEYFNLGGETSSLVGFDYLDIDRSIAFGTPPAQGVILAGDFNTDAIITAFTAREYEAVNVDGMIVDPGNAQELTLLQGGDPTKVDLQNRNPANPFGGELGRRELVAVAPGYLLNSPSKSTFQNLVETYTDDQPALSEDSSYAAAARAISDGEGLLIQALFLNPLSVGFAPGDPASLPPGLTQEQIEAILANPLLNGETYGPLAPYTLAIMADRQEGDEQVILVALVYSDEAAAQSAAAELTNRLAAFSNALVTNSDVPLIEDVEGAVMGEPRVYTDEVTGYSVAIAEIRYPMPEPILYNSQGEPAEEGETGMTRTPGILFRRLVNAIYTRSFTPLAIME